MKKKYRIRPEKSTLLPTLCKVIPVHSSCDVIYWIRLQNYSLILHILSTWVFFVSRLKEIAQTNAFLRYSKNRIVRNCEKCRDPRGDYVVEKSLFYQKKLCFVQKVPNIWTHRRIFHGVLSTRLNIHKNQGQLVIIFPSSVWFCSFVD